MSNSVLRKIRTLPLGQSKTGLWLWGIVASLKKEGDLCKAIGGLLYTIGLYIEQQISLEILIMALNHAAKTLPTLDGFPPAPHPSCEGIKLKADHLSAAGPVSLQLGTVMHAIAVFLDLESSKDHLVVTLHSAVQNLRIAKIDIDKEKGISSG